MTTLAIPTVTLSDDGTTATFHRQHWSQAVPVTSLPAWLAFYAKLAKIGPVQEASYLPWVAAIKAAMKR